MWVLDILSNIGKMSPIQIAILMEYARYKGGPRKITEILNILSEDYEGLWIPKKGTIYPAVHNLHVRGYLKLHAIKPYGYSISDNGIKLIEDVMSNLEIQLKAYLKFMTKMLEHYSQINKTEAAKLVKVQQVILQEQLEILKKLPK